MDRIEEKFRPLKLREATRCNLPEVCESWKSALCLKEFSPIAPYYRVCRSRIH